MFKNINFYKLNVEIFIFLFFLIIMGLNSNNLDYLNYKETYDILIHVKGFEFAYLYLQKIFNYIGFNFFQFRFTIYFILLIFLHKYVKIYLKETKYFYVLYFLYPFFLDNIEIRNFIGMVILMYSFLFYGKTIKKKLISVILILIASMFQNIYVIFILYPFFYSASKRKKGILILGGIISIFLMLCPKVTIIILQWILINILGDPKRIHYINKISSSNIGVIVPVCLQCLNFFISYYEIKELKSIKNISLKYKQIIECIYNLNLYLFLFLALYRLNSQFYRILQNIYPMMHICFLISINYLSKNKKNFLKKIYIVYICIIFLYVILISHFKDIFISTFVNNYLLMIFK